MRQTGGGPAPLELNETEQVFYDRMCERPAMTGLASGVDTDGNTLKTVRNPLYHSKYSNS